MAQHFDITRRHGIDRVRDGLPWRHDPGPRFRVARKAGVEVIWDLNHFDPPEDLRAHALRVARAANPKAPLWICPVNEPSIYPMLCGLSQDSAVRLALLMTKIVKDHHPDVRVITTDPIVGIGERQYAATDTLVAAGLVDVVGVTYYPHTARTALRKVLNKTSKRYRLPVMVAETSWHDGHPVHQRMHPGWHKGDWLRHILDEAEFARQKGAIVEGICWYPIVDCAPWERPRSRHRWSHGLIRRDLGVDPHLAAALIELNQEIDQLSFNFGTMAS